MPPVWFQWGYSLTSAVCKKVLETKVIPWFKKITKKSDYVFQQNGDKAKTVQDMVGCRHELLAQRFLSPRVTRFFNSFDFSFWTHIEEKTRYSNTGTLKAFVDRAFGSMRKGLVRKVFKSFRPRLARVIAAKDGHNE